MTALAREFEGLVAKFGAELEKEAAAISPEAGMLGAAWHGLWKANAAIVALAAENKKPAPDVLKVLQDGLVAAGKPIADARANLDFPLPSHAQGMSDASLGMLWTGAEAPLESIEAAKEACDFYLNKVRKQSKDEGNAHHMAFANLIRDGLAALHDFVKDNDLKMGLRWAAAAAADGKELDAAAAAAAVKSAGGAGGVAASSAAASTPATSAASAASASKPAAASGGAGCGSASASGASSSSPAPAAASSGAASLPAKGPASPPPAAKAAAAASSAFAAASAAASTPAGVDAELKAALEEVQAKARALEARIVALEAAAAAGTGRK